MRGTPWGRTEGHVMSRGSIRSLRWAACAGAATLVAGGILAACGGSPGSSNSSGGNQNTGSSGRLVDTTPPAKGSLSSITWDLPSGEPTTLDYVKSADYSPDLMVSNMCDSRDLLNVYRAAPGRVICVLMWMPDPYTVTAAGSYRLGGG